MIADRWSVVPLTYLPLQEDLFLLRLVGVSVIRITLHLRIFILHYTNILIIVVIITQKVMDNFFMNISKRQRKID